MAGEIATAYVRIRPQMASFRSETESGIKGAFSNIGKIVGGAFAAVGAFEFGKHIVEEASGQQAAFAVLDRTIRNVGASTRGFGDDLESVLAKEARLKGFSDQQLAAGLTQLVSVTHNTRKGFKDLVLAEDLARARHKDLTVASLALSRAEQGSTTTLSRFGIKVPEVTAAVDRLKKAHDQAVIAGAHFTGQTKLNYDALLAQAKATDKAATRAEALRLVQERFGGVASTFAKSSAGEFARFHENINQLEIAIGKKLLPGLSGAAAGLNKYIAELSTSDGLQNAVRGGAHDIGEAFGTFKSIVEAVGPPLLAVARGAEEVTKAIGIAPILTAVVAYKGLVSIIGKAAQIEKAYAAAVELGRAKKVADAAASNSQFGFFTRLNDSLHATSIARARDAEAATAQASATGRAGEAALAHAGAADGETASLRSLAASAGETVASFEAGIRAQQAFTASLGETTSVVSRVRAELAPPIVLTFAGDPAPLLAAIGEAEAAVTASRARLETIPILLAGDDAPLLASLANAEEAIARARTSLAAPVSSTIVGDSAPLVAALTQAESAVAAARANLAAPVTATLAADDVALTASLDQAQAFLAKIRAEFSRPVIATLTADTAPLNASLAGTDAELAATERNAIVLTGALDGLATAGGRVVTTFEPLGPLLASAGVETTAFAAGVDRLAIAEDREAGSAVRVTESLGGVATGASTAAGSIVELTVALEANTAASDASAIASARLGAGLGTLNFGAVAGEAKGAESSLAALETTGAGLAGTLPKVGEGAAAAEVGIASTATAAERAAESIGAFGTGIGRLALGAVGGPVGAAVLGLAALAGGIAYLATRESSAERATKNLQKTFLAFGESQDQAKQSAIDLAQAHAALGSDRVATSQARTNVETARAALATTGAAKGTAEYSRLVVGLQGALAAYRSQLVQLRADELRLSEAQQARAKAVSDQAANNRSAIASTAGLAKAAAGDARTSFFSQAVEIKNLQLEVEKLNAARQEATRQGQKFGQQEALNNLRQRLNTLQSKQAAAAVDDFAKKLQNAIPKLQAQSPLVAHNTSLLLAYTQQVGHVPSAKVTNLILRTPNLNATLADVDAKLKSLDPQAFADGQAIGIAWGKGILAGIHGVAANPLANAVKRFEGPLAGVSKGIQAKVRTALGTGIFTPAQIAKQFGITTAQVSAIEKAANEAADKATAAAKKAHDRQIAKPKNLQNIIPFKVQLELAGAVTTAQQRKALEDEIAALNQELTQHITESSRRAIELEKASAQAQLAGLASTVAASGDTVAKTIATAHQAIEKSISDARTNLDSIGAKLGASIDKFLGKGGVGGLDSAQTAAFTKLKDLIKGGGSRLDIERAGSQLQADLAAKAATPGKSAKDQVRALTDAFNHGKISLKTFNRDVAELLKKDKISYGAAGKLLGRSFEDGLRSQVTGLEKQAGAIAAVPEKFRRGAGGGDALKIIRPLEVIQKENALIRQSQDRHAAQAARQRERIIRASERTARAAEKTAGAVAASNFAKNHMIHGRTSKQAKAAAKAGIRP